MKLLSFVLASLVAVVAARDIHALTWDTPVPWKQVGNQEASKWAFYSEPKGTNLEHAKPKYHACTVDNEAGKESVFSTFAGKPDFEFQLIKSNILAANCINCTPQMLGNYYGTKISGYIHCKKYENTHI